MTDPFQVWSEELGGTPEHPRVIHAKSPGNAAKAFAEQQFEQRPFKVATVFVKFWSRDGWIVQKFEVQREYKPVFVALEIFEKPGKP